MPGFDLDTFLANFASAAQRRGFAEERIAVPEGDPLRIWTRPSSKSDARLCVYLSAGIHGDESAGCDALLQAMRDHKLPDSFDWIVAPALNPSGLRAGTRENADGIDLNRDFHRCQSSEICALIQWWKNRTRPCNLHFSLHEDWEAAGFYLYAINTSDRDCFSRPLLESLGETITLQTDGPIDNHELCQPGLIQHEAKPDEPEGWPEAIWLVNRHPTLSYTVEAPGLLPYAERVNGLAIALQTAIALIKPSGEASAKARSTE